MPGVGLVMATTDEEQIIIRYFDDLVNAIVEPGPVARSLFSMKLIGRETREEASNAHI